MAIACPDCGTTQDLPRVPVGIAALCTTCDRPLECTAGYSVTAAPAFSVEKIVRESGSNKVEFSSENRWGAPLDEMLRRVLTQDLADRLPGGMVALPDDPTPTGGSSVVVSLLQFQSGPSGSVVLDGSWSLLKPKVEAPAVTKPVNIVEQGGSDPGAQARAMSRAVGQLADQIAASLSRQGEEERRH